MPVAPPFFQVNLPLQALKSAALIRSAVEAECSTWPLNFVETLPGRIAEGPEIDEDKNVENV